MKMMLRLLFVAAAVFFLRNHPLIVGIPVAIVALYALAIVVYGSFVEKRTRETEPLS